MRSMTGHGRGECTRKGVHAAIELTSVNRKNLETSSNLPRELEALEPGIREIVSKKLSRGRVSLRFAIEMTEANPNDRVHLDAALARAYMARFQELGRDLGVKEPVALDTVLRAPGVLQPVTESASPEACWPAIETALKKALKDLVEMRRREGANLRMDLRARIKAVDRSVKRIEKLAPRVTGNYRKQLLERIAQAGVDPELDEERLLREVAYFADRSDITEELTRLRSHFDQFERFAQSTRPVGRTLDFLSQEMNREINTIGSKANDALISREVVHVKAELERFREQVQNVE